MSTNEIHKNEWLQKLMRAGFIAKGIIYILIGVLAFQVAIGVGGSTTGQDGVLMKVASQPFGRILLGLIAVGLVGLTIWYLIRGVKDTDDAGSDFKGLIKRTGYILSGLFYAGIAFSAFQRVFNSSGGGQGDVSSWTALVMQYPLGRWSIAAGGVVMMGVGLYQFYRAYSARFMHHLNKGDMQKEERHAARRAGQFGYSARGVIYTLIGIFLTQAAVTYDPEKVGGIGRALTVLTQRPYGPYLLSVVALGFIAYGLFAAITLSRHRKL